MRWQILVYCGLAALISIVSLTLLTSPPLPRRGEQDEAASTSAEVGPARGAAYQGGGVRLAAATTAFQRCDALIDACKESLDLGDIPGARAQAEELLHVAARDCDRLNYGNAVHDGNMVLGRIAVREGAIDTAIGYLLAAGDAPASPQLSSFGPNMSLAQDLLLLGRRSEVVEYLEKCRKFWYGSGRLDDWIQTVREGGLPRFGANLRF